MPEGPELHLAARLVNTACAGVTFAAPINRSQVSKSPEVNYDSKQFHISAQARGKELKVRTWKAVIRLS